MQQDTETKTIQFANGRAQFYAAAANRSCYPLGAPRSVVVGSEGNSTTQFIPKPQVTFSQNRYSTDNYDIAVGLISDKTNFAKPFGWYLEVGCLPEDIREIYNECSVEGKRKIALACIDGATAEKALELLDDADMERAERVSTSMSDANQITCPAPGCGLSMGGSANARAAMIEHLTVAHPDYQAS